MCVSASAWALESANVTSTHTNTKTDLRALVKTLSLLSKMKPMTTFRLTFPPTTRFYDFFFFLTCAFALGFAFGQPVTAILVSWVSTAPF